MMARLEDIRQQPAKGPNRDRPSSCVGRRRLNALILRKMRPQGHGYIQFPTCVPEWLIKIDWSDLKADHSLHTTRALLPVGGRSLILYEPGTS